MKYLPCAIASARCTKNVGVEPFMSNVRGAGRGSFISKGLSVHIQRVERMYRDVTHCVSSTFIDIFHFLEEKKLLHRTE